MVELEKLKLEIEAVGNSIRELKEKGGGKEEIGALVTKLNALKQEYADNNNGLGVDGKPYQKPLSKAEKKKLEKEKKAAAAAATAKTQEVSTFLKDRERGTVQNVCTFLKDRGEAL